MLHRYQSFSRLHKSILIIGLGILGLIGYLLYRVNRPAAPYKVGVILSRTEVTSEEWEVVEYLINKRLEELNQSGGINGRHLQAVYLDDQGDSTKLKKLLAETVQDKQVIGFVGAQGIWRALIAGPLVTQKQIPFIGNYVYTQFTSQYPTMYTASLGIKEGSLIFRELLKAKASRVGFIGQEGAPHSRAFLNGIKNLKAQGMAFDLTYIKFFPKGHQATAPEMKTLADSVKAKVDFLVFTNEPQTIYPVLEALEKNQVRVPVYCGLIDIAQLDASDPYFRTAELFDFNSLGIPGAYNVKLHEKLAGLQANMQGRPVKEYQLGLGGSLADVIGLLAEAAAVSGLSEETPVRTRINQGLNQYIGGQKIFKGWFSDLYFTTEKALAGSIMVAWKPRNRNMSVLAPMQYVLADTTLTKAQVLYTSLDMVRIDQIDDGEGDFQATFYLQVQSDRELDIEQLDFTNAARNAINHEPLIEIRLLRTRKDTTGFRFQHYLYQVSGKFYFDPDLRRYPLDEQQFPISLQTSNALKPFLIQPSHREFRDSVFEAKGWNYQQQFVGFDQEIISSTNALNQDRKNIPYYKFTFMFVMKRSPVDYFLKTLVPLFTILIIAYFSVYIPPREFEAQAGVQVTAVLSSIALYFSTYKPEIQYATASDRIFIFSYVMVTTLIGTSILIYVARRNYPFLKSLTQIYQRILFPLIVIGFSVYIRWF